ncbi:MAG: class I SAM-dependent methyltransferase, partial [Bacteroidia bacterium]|nr:class I SAM-dependent methyltransferase [Bacteroidia bacterium]
MVIREIKEPVRIIEVNNRVIKCYDDLGNNIDLKTVDSFGKEWKAFHKFSDDDIKKIGDAYFDIVIPGITNREMIAADFGCGTGRWSKYFHDKVSAVAAIDPSDAILSASSLLKNIDNVFLYKASIDN